MKYPSGRLDEELRVISRRRALRGMGAALVTAPFAKVLFGCSSDGDSSTSSGTGTDSGTDADATGTGEAGAWATGGTAVMAGNYPDPFTSGLGAACTLTCAATLGPCYAETVERKDISEGHDGLPVRLAFLVVDESCTPVPNASVDIWHCAPEGLYSGSDASDFCTSGDATARAARWFRGVQTADANGRVDFDTCFPGWYSGRTIHIHFTIRVNGTEYVTSQLVFDDALDDEIVSTQPLYGTRGSRDTSNTNDNVVGGADLANYTFETSRMSDGAMLAWKAIVIRSSTGTALCSIGGNGGGGGPRDGGGPPPP
ncbi:protocatechuate 3,4-dioxygenase [Pendulispora rubella]|uniref:Protocatechuate 3,4-dioxygenase n=1 Tax=Pendulispora rubella TaxID=2741070 RepID=A0ABZ2LKM4_9BACT